MLMWKAALLAPVALALVSATPVQTRAPVRSVQEPVQLVRYPLVKRLDCEEGSGTAFRVGQNHWVSVAHVTAMHGCTVGGQPIALTQQDGKKDFSRFDTPGNHNGLRIDCGGFKPGHWYWAVGYAYGLPIQMAVALYATSVKAPDGKRILIGPQTVIPGMSGGPVMDERGTVVGLVNSYLPETPLSFSRELRDTSAC